LPQISSFAAILQGEEAVVCGFAGNAFWKGSNPNNRLFGTSLKRKRRLASPSLALQSCVALAPVELIKNACNGRIGKLTSEFEHHVLS
jgi:hypothetical protein